ncbi:MAG: riboflavin synthase [Pirellulales bacterium]
MFTGLVESFAEVTAVVAEPPGLRLTVRDPAIAAEARQGESIAVSGCCLTAVEIRDGQVAFQAGPETLARTTLGQLKAGSKVNLERSLRVGDRLGGHFVTGHVDAVGKLLDRMDEQDWSTFWFGVPAGLTRQMASKGSIAVDGVSLTLVEVHDNRFSVALIPHTLHVTTLGTLRVGDAVNLETDLLAKYVQQHLQGDR